MRKEIIKIDEKKGVYQITTRDERFYVHEDIDKITGLPVMKYKPSITWIAGYYPKGVAFYKWLASKGWDEAETLKVSAGERGSRVHTAIEILIAGGTITMEEKIVNKITGESEELGVEEYEAVMSFVNWCKEVKPTFIIQDLYVESNEYTYAGTLDCIAKIGEDFYLIDFKTSQYVWPEHELQISAYKQCLFESDLAKNMEIKDIKLGLLQLGYKKNKRGYKLNEVDDKFSLFLSARDIWAYENAGKAPKQKEYPLKLTLAEEKKEEKVEEKVEKKEIKRPKPKKDVL